MKKHTTYYAKQTLSNNEKHKSQTKREKLNIETLQRNAVNTRKQVFWQYHKAKKAYETFSNLLVIDPTRMFRKFLPRFIKNENKEKLKIRRQLAVENSKVKSIYRKSALKSIQNAS